MLRIAGAGQHSDGQKDDNQQGQKYQPVEDQRRRWRLARRRPTVLLPPLPRHR